ncbi:MAG: YciI family protein [Burkholderiales bacterium]|nr:YciI family protein [Burkholderiales bacterium]
MLYAIVAEDATDSAEKRKAARPAHIERMKQLIADGRVIVAGPFPAIDSPDPGPAGFTGSLIVAEFESLESAQAWINSDPYVTEGVFANVSVKPFVKVLP